MHEVKTTILAGFCEQCINIAKNKYNTNSFKHPYNQRIYSLSLTCCWFDPYQESHDVDLQPWTHVFVRVEN